MRDHIVSRYTYALGLGNSQFEEYDLKKNPSLTVPGMTLSLETLLKKYVRGEAVTTLQPVFSDDPDIPENLERMSEMDRQDMARDIKAGITAYQVSKSAEKAQLAAQVAAKTKLDDSTSTLLEMAD